MTSPPLVRRLAALALTAGILLAGTTIPTTTAVARANDTAGTSIAATAIDDVQSFWASTMPDVYGRSYEPIPDDRLFPYSSDDPPPACGGRGATPYEQVAGNAFYCPVDDFVAWDVEQLVPQLEHRFGDFAVALVLAHEWGHVVQARTDSTINATIYLENQADCFAGAWARHVESGRSRLLSADAADLDTALGGYLAFRDPPGVDPAAGRRARQRVRPGERVPGRLRGRGRSVRDVRERSAPGDGEPATPATRTRRTVVTFRSRTRWISCTPTSTTTGRSTSMGPHP